MSTQSDPPAQDDQQSGQPGQDGGQSGQGGGRPGQDGGQPAQDDDQAEQPTPVLCGSGTTITIQCGGTPVQYHPGVIQSGVTAPEKVDASDAVDGQVLTASGGTAAWADASAAPPPGSGMPFFGSVVPDGWLLCNGAEVNRTTYAALFAAIGTTYGVGNGNTTFQLPDLRGRFLLGLDNMGGTSADRVTAADTLNVSGGAETHTLTEADLPAHRHSVFFSDATVVSSNAGSRQFHELTSPAAIPDKFQRNGASYPGHPMGLTGAGQAHNNMPPYLSINYIIKTWGVRPRVQSTLRGARG